MRYFRHYEDLENAFRRRIATLLPRKHAGTAVFWEDFQRLLTAIPAKAASHAEHYITSNPRDCLAFGTPRQVLQAALSMAGTSPVTAIGGGVAAVAERFGLQRHLNQPVRSLSGGETVRLALAKAFVGAARADRLTLASPFSWLSLNNRCYFHDLAAHCEAHGRALEVFALEGEDRTDADTGGALLPGPDFHLRFHKARVVLNSALDRLQDQQRQAVVEDGEYNLRSPCLIQGDNGQGKSLVAKIMAGAMPWEGEADVDTAGNDGRVRLLLQDIVNQAMMRSFRQLANVAAPGVAPRVGRFYDAIRAGMLARTALAPDEVKSFEGGCAAPSPASLLELKILLAALRLGARPSALVMDEPDWGLRQASALAFVRGVIRAAHGAGIPVLLISHKPWWQKWAASKLQVDKVPTEQGRDAADLFRIKITRTMPAR